MAPCSKVYAAFASDFHDCIRADCHGLFTEGCIDLLFGRVFVKTVDFLTLASTGPSSLYFRSGMSHGIKTLVLEATGGTDSVAMFEPVG